MPEHMWIMFFAGLATSLGPALVALKVTSRRAWRNGYEQGCDDEAESCALVPARQVPADWPEPVSDFKNPPKGWNVTESALAALARPYYEPLARGAGAIPTPVTTAPCSGDDGRMTLKGDSPGPGNCPCCGSALRDVRDDAPFCWDCGLYACDPAADCDNEDHKPAMDFVFIPANPGPPPATIFDDLITCWPQLATPLDSPPGGVAPEPSAPAPGTDMGAGPDNPGSWQPGAEVKPPAPELAPGRDVPGHDPGAGAEFTLTQALADPDPIFGALDDTGAFALIEFELRHLKVLAAEGFKLTPWKEART